MWINLNAKFISHFTVFIKNVFSFAFDNVNVEWNLVVGIMFYHRIILNHLKSKDETLIKNGWSEVFEIVSHCFYGLKNCERRRNLIELFFSPFILPSPALSNDQFYHFWMLLWKIESIKVDVRIVTMIIYMQWAITMLIIN